MGCFSWEDCITGEPVLNGIERPVYLLIPKDFGGGHIKEPCYDGYGHFGGKDVYELVAEWNKEYIPTLIQSIVRGMWHCRTNEKDVRALKNYYSGRNIHEGIEDYSILELRWLGIIMACYDEDNESLPYPIKITYSDSTVYENCRPSWTDPNQGMGYEDSDEEVWEDEENE